MSKKVKREMITRKIVVNKCYGGFSLSHEAEAELARRKGIKISDVRGIERDDKELVRLVEEWGEKANGRYANLCITEIPKKVKWSIEEQDGMEWIAEEHITWW